jgi:hypothetical protein
MTLLLVTLVSMLLAALMSIVAWHSSREERRRSEARVAALTAEIHDEPATGLAAEDEPEDLFAARQSAQGGFRFAAVAAGGLFVCGSAAALAVVSSNASSNASGTASSRAVHAAVDRSIQTPSVSVERRADASSAAAVPIELVALGYERDGDRLIVRGIVRNPSSGTPLDRVTAVVLMFKDDGGFLGSGRGTVETPALGPGGETAFAVTVPGANAVGRYRVSFRSADRVVPHIDRRSRDLNLEPRTLEP